MKNSINQLACPLRNKQPPRLILMWAARLRLSCVTLLLSAQHLMDGGGNVSPLSGTAPLCRAGPCSHSSHPLQGAFLMPSSPGLGLVHPVSITPCMHCPHTQPTVPATTLLRSVSSLCLEGIIQPLCIQSPASTWHKRYATRRFTELIN